MKKKRLFDKSGRDPFANTDDQAGLHVTDDAHAVDLSDSVSHEGKTTLELAAEHDFDMGIQKAGQSDLDLERELDALPDDVSDELDRDKAAEKYVKGIKKRVEQNVKHARTQARQQSKQLVTLEHQANFAADSGKMLAEAEHAVYGQSMEFGSGVSMTLNDMLANGGVNEKVPGSKKRQKTVCLQGVMVIMDEDMAERAMGHGPKKSKSKNDDTGLVLSKEEIKDLNKFIDSEFNKLSREIAKERAHMKQSLFYVRETDKERRQEERDRRREDRLDDDFARRMEEIEEEYETENDLYAYECL